MHTTGNVQDSISYGKIWRIALVTSPLLGLFGATPVFVFAKTEISRLLAGFLTVTVMIFLFWTINIALLRVWNSFKKPVPNIFRYLISIVACTLTSFIVISQTASMPDHELPSEFAKQIPFDFEKRNVLVMPRSAALLPLIQSQSINIIIGVLIELVLLRQRKQFIEVENANLKTANLEAKHGQLKQQLQPHFLFNSLSTLSALIKRSPEDAENYLEKLSELLRFSTTSDNQATISLDKELELCSYYLQMQQVRFGNALQFEIEVPAVMRLTGLVPVYSIQLLVENAIKHNEVTVTNPLRIHITSNQSDGEITVSNNLQKKPSSEESTGVGLANLSERYRILDKKEINIQSTENEFRVTIKVLKHENSDHRR